MKTNQIKTGWIAGAGLLWLAYLGGLVLANPVHAQLPAFPGATGFGHHATGGRGGSVYYVTTTNDFGAGSFRDAVSQPNRTVVFAVSGVIDYQPPRYNVKNNVTIAGQTAPGDGVVLYGDGIGFTDANNSITRFIRFRMGQGATGEDTVGVARGHDMIFDHISATWSLDEVFSISGSPQPTNITIQASIIGQGLEDHSAGGLIQTDGGVSILRSLYIDNGTRNPKVKGVNEFVNNVVYNWTTAAYILGDSAGQSYANVIGNYFVNGPDSGNDGAFSRGNLNFHLFATNNWQDKNRNGTLDGTLLTQSDYDVNDWQTSPFPHPIAATNVFPALTAVKLVISDVGPSWRRDTVDAQLITELVSWGTLGQTIFTEFDPPMNGPGPFKGGPVPLDTDLDGMPDYWEAGQGMATNAPNNNDPSPDGSGYTRLEDYLNWLAEPHGVAPTNTPVHIDLRQFTAGFTNFAPIYSVSGVSNGTVTLLNGHLVRFIPDAGLIGRAGFGFTVIDSQGSTLTRPMGLFLTPQPPVYERVWHGDGLSNNWEVLGDANWFDGQSLLYPFETGDSVVIDDTGSSHPALNLVGTLEPALVTVDATRDYRLRGSGSLEGAMSLNKSGSGTLTFHNTNHFTGPTTVSNGTLLVHGHLAQSPVTVRSGAVLGGNGRLGVSPVLQAGATLAPGGDAGSPGTLTVASALTLSGGVTNRFDLSDDPSGLVETNDSIIVAGDLNLTGANTLQVNLRQGPLANGVYTLVSYGGSLNGSLSNLGLVGANGVLTNPPGAISILVDNTRPAANLVWTGDGSANFWDTGTNANWMNGPLPDWFYFGDTVLFDDSGSTVPPVTIPGTVNPASVAVDSTNDYTFSGSGRISGTGGITKAGSGTLTILTANDYTGVTTIAGGALTLTQLSDGGVPGPLGMADSAPANLLLDGSTLRYSGGDTGTDRGASLSAGGGTIDVTSSGTTLTWSGILTGSGALTKVGSGRLDVDAINDYSGGTTVTEGVLRLANDDGAGAGRVTLNGVSKSAVFRFGRDAQTLQGTLNVVGQHNHTENRGNNTLKDLVGSGTLHLDVYDSGTTLTLAGNMSSFDGTLTAGEIANLRFNPSTGSANAMFDLGNTSCLLNNRNGNLTAYIGALIGGPNTILEGASSANNPTTYVIGGRDLDTTFAGTIQQRASARTVAIVKEGTGTLTLTGNNTYTEPTTVNSGTLLVSNTSGSGTGTGGVAVTDSGALGGTGTIAGPVTVNAGGALAPGPVTGAGTLTVNNSLTLSSGSLLDFDLGIPGASDMVTVSGSLGLSGTLHLSSLPGFGAGTYTLITYGGALSGSLPAIGSKPTGFSCVVSTDTAGQVRVVITPLAEPVIDSVSHLNGDLILSGSGPANATYYVITSTDILLPLPGWTPIATHTFDVSGSFAFTNAIVPGTLQQFYRLQLP